MQVADLAELRRVAEHAVPVDVVDLPGCQHDRYDVTAGRIIAASYQDACGGPDHAETHESGATV